jgi:hypothetical protein
MSRSDTDSLLTTYAAHLDLLPLARRLWRDRLVTGTQPVGAGELRNVLRSEEQLRKL